MGLAGTRRRHPARAAVAVIGTAETILRSTAFTERFCKHALPRGARPAAVTRRTENPGLNQPGPQS
jgi:hypothetical protein